jgi:hypothetical protein
MMKIRDIHQIIPAQGWSASFLKTKGDALVDRRRKLIAWALVTMDGSDERDIVGYVVNTDEGPWAQCAESDDDFDRYIYEEEE